MSQLKTKPAHVETQRVWVSNVDKIVPYIYVRRGKHLKVATKTIKYYLIICKVIKQNLLHLRHLMYTKNLMHSQVLKKDIINENKNLVYKYLKYSY